MDNCLNSDHLIGIRAKTAAEEVNRLRNWKRTKERFEENKARIKKDCLAVLSGMPAFSWEKYTAALEAKGYTVKLKMDASVTVRGYTIQSGNSVYKSSVIGRELTPSRIQETWEKMRPENRYGQMTPSERVAFALSDEGKNFQFLDTQNSRQQYIEMLTREIRKVYPEFEYQKNDKGMYELLQRIGNQEQAIKNTKALEARYEDEDYASHKPCTTVYKLVEELNKPEEVIARLNRQSRP